MTFTFDLISDLHVDTWPGEFSWESNVTSPYCVVAGDVSQDLDVTAKTLEHLGKCYQAVFYIDGNHEPEYVLEDAVLSFRKLKTNGYLIFDDYGWGGPDLTQKGIDAFLNGYYKRIKFIGEAYSQVFLQKLPYV